MKGIKGIKFPGVLKCFLAFLIMGCQPHQKELPVLSYKMNPKGETETYTISYDHFTNQLGESFTTQNIQNKVFIANFFFTRCPSICPPMRGVLPKIAAKFNTKEDFLIISHTIDPQHDTLEVLKNYGEATGVAPDRWAFIRASTEQTKKQAHRYMTNFRPMEDGTDFYHSSYVALVDQSQHIRGFYNLLVAEEVERLGEDITLLLNERPLNQDLK